MPDVYPPATASTAAPLSLEMFGATATLTTTGPSEQAQAEADAEREFLATAQKRFRTCATAEEVLRREAVTDQEFRALRQWPDQIKRQRDLAGKPCLTIDRLGQPIDLTINQQRQSKIGIQVSPVDDIADPDTADILQGLIRHIEVQSEAEIAYDTAFEHAVTSGWGYLRVLADYIPGTFDQELAVKRVWNPLAVYLDPAVQEADASDARFAFVVSDVAKDEFTALYGETATATLEEWASVGDHNYLPDWMPEGKVRIAEYWWVEDVPQTLALVNLGGGRTTTMPVQQVSEGASVVRTRTDLVPKVQWAKLNGAGILHRVRDGQPERGVWVGTSIPIVPVVGKELVVNGQREWRGVVRPARDAQSMYNVWVSTMTEVINLGRRSQVIGAEGQFEGHEAEWQQANLRNLPYLEYKPVTIAGQQAPPPMIQSVEPPIQAYAVAIRQADQDLKATTGMYDPSLGERGPQQSGKAITALQRQGELVTGNYGDNLARAVRRVARILLECIPKIYDAPRVLRIIGLDEQERTVRVNQPTKEQGVQRIYDLTIGRYDVTVQVGPAYQTRRQESAAATAQLVQAFPPIMQVSGDLLVENMDFPNRHQIAERLKKTLPPQLQDQGGEPGQGQAAIPPQVQQQMQALMQQHQQLTEALNAAQQELETNRLKLESAERIATMGNKTQLAIAELKAESAEQLKLLELRVQSIEAEAEAGRTYLEGNRQRAHELDVAAMEQERAAVEAAAGRAHEAGMAQAQQAASTREAEASRTFTAEQANANRQAAAKMKAATPAGGAVKR